MNRWEIYSSQMSRTRRERESYIFIYLYLFKVDRWKRERRRLDSRERERVWGERKSFLFCKKEGRKERKVEEVLRCLCCSKRCERVLTEKSIINRQREKNKRKCMKPCVKKKKKKRREGGMNEERRMKISFSPLTFSSCRSTRKMDTNNEEEK